jgi:uncharacterized protein YlxW (UPF0749 family)
VATVNQPGATALNQPGAAPASPSGAMLDDLLNNVLDPGYRIAWQAPPARRRRWWDGPLLWLACLAVGLLLVMSYQLQHRSAPAREEARKDLITRIERLQVTGDSLDARAKALAAEVADLRNAQLPGGGEELRRLELASGAVAVTGPGVRIELDEPAAPTPAASGRPGVPGPDQVAVLRDRDIRAVVNQLWAGGAEAIAVNGLRLTSTSFIRFAGESVLVDFQPISPPYTIEAIGDRNGLLVNFADSGIARQLKTMAAVNGITFEFSGKSKLQLQSVTVGRPHYAGLGAVPGTSGPSASPSPSSTQSPTSTESPR